MTLTGRFTLVNLDSRISLSIPFATSTKLHAPRRTVSFSRFPLSAFRFSGFTLIEIMLVVGIMGIVLTMGVPMVYKVWHRAPMISAVKDVVEVCSHARALAIMQGKEVDVIFHPKEGRLEVGSAATNDAPQTASSAPALSVNAPSPSGSGLSARFSDRVSIELMDINKLPHEFRDDDLARVRFFPNGTCDELTLILVSDQNERREITLEITTGLANVESDPRRFR
jgi:prepilin-type N-terminal cleavage/methylation domain-containing protein